VKYVYSLVLRCLLLLNTGTLVLLHKL